MNNQPKHIPASDALPTKNYWIAFIIVTVILIASNCGNAYAEVLALKDTAYELSSAETKQYYLLTIGDALIASALACAWGIILNIALRYKTWRWRWVLLYAVTAVALCTAVSSIVTGKLTAGSVGWIWWAVIGLYRREYVNNNLLSKPTRNMPNTQNSYIQTACPICGKVGLPTGNKCAFCGEIIFDADHQNKTANANPDAQTYHNNNSQTSNINSSFFCTKCGRKLLLEDNFCKACGTAVDAAKIETPQNKKISIREVETADRSMPSVENFSPYYDAYKVLLNEIAPLTASEQYNNYWTKPRKRIEFECKCFMAFMHYLATREDKYSEINSISYMNKLLLHISEKETFDRRIGDYLEIDLFEKTLPSLDVLLEKLDPLDAENAKKCDAINYIYAFSAFAKNAKHYAVSRDFKEIANLIDAVSINFFNDDLAQIFTSSINVYNKLKNCTIPPENKQPQNLNNAK